MVDYSKYVRKEDTQWCPGCTNGIVERAIINSVDALGWEMRDVVFISGIGCSGRMSSYMKCNTVHTPHGRTLPVAEGIARMCPGKHVIAVSGDGDGGSIGRSHFAQECLENVDMTYIIINNFTYALTKGQASPTTPTGTKAAMMPYGVYTRTLDLCNFAIGSGATFVARSTVLDLRTLEKTIQAAFLHHGFSFIESPSCCPINFGLKNGMRSTHEVKEWMETLFLQKKKFDILSDEEKAGKFPTGILKQELGVPEGNDAYAAQVKEIQAIAREQPAVALSSYGEAKGE
jgi:2-oxoglutarate ferredoxin oxidoreductase subunit beta